MATNTNSGSVKTVRTMCPMNCHPTLCGMLVDIADGGVENVRGDPDNPDSRGFLCVRGRASREIIGNPDRLLQPMRRRSRGSDNWQSISWQDAIDQIADTLGTIQPHEFGIWLGHGDAATNYGTRIGGMLSRRFAHLYGCQWWHPSMICWGLGGFGLALTGLLEVHTKEDMSANSSYVLIWGANLDSQPNTIPHLKAAKARGAKIVAIDIRKTAATQMADESVIIQPGSDAALALAMMQVIIDRQLIDKAFIEQHSIGFDQLAAHVSGYTPAWAAPITGIDPDVIEQLAITYASNPPATILMGGSSMHKSANGWTGARAIACLPALTGNSGIPGGGLSCRHGSPSHGQGLNVLQAPGESRCQHVIPNQMSAMTDAICDGTVKALFLSGTNMVSSFADTNRLRVGLERAELVVCQDLFMSDTIRECADIALPATAWLEQLGCKMTHTHLYLMEQALPAAGEAKTLSETLQLLANKMQIADFFPWVNDEEMINAAIDHPSTGHTSVEKMRANSGRCELKISHHAYPSHQYSTPSGKVEFYSERATEHGLAALPEYQPVQSTGSYPLQLRQGRTMSHFHSFYNNGAALPSLARLNQQAQIWLQTADAEARDISNGDRVRLFNQRGELHAIAQLSDQMQSGAVWMRDGWSDLNRLTDGDKSIPDSAVDLFPFSTGQAAYDAFVEVAREAQS